MATRHIPKREKAAEAGAEEVAEDAEPEQDGVDGAEDGSLGETRDKRGKDPRTWAIYCGKRNCPDPKKERRLVARIDLWEKKDAHADRYFMGEWVKHKHFQNAANSPVNPSKQLPY